MPKHPKDLILLASRLNGLSGINKPWHLKANYQTFDPDGNPQDQGIFEEWWDGPTKYKLSYVGKGFNRVEYRDGDKDLITDGPEWIPQPESMIEEYLVNPLPNPDYLKKWGYTAINATSGGVKLKCVNPVRLTPVENHLADSYCFLPDRADIRVEARRGGFGVLFNRITLDVGHYFAEQINAMNSKLPVVNVNVTSLNFSQKIDDSVFTVLAVPATPKPASPSNLSPIVVAQRRSSGKDPQYPAEAKAERVQGKVVMEAIISKAGDVADLYVISGPEELQQPAYDAVKTWKYKPYMLNGRPVDVRAEMDVIYKLAGE